RLPRAVRPRPARVLRRRAPRRRRPVGRATPALRASSLATAGATGPGAALALPRLHGPPPRAGRGGRQISPELHPPRSAQVPAPAAARAGGGAPAGPRRARRAARAHRPGLLSLPHLSRLRRHWPARLSSLRRPGNGGARGAHPALGAGAPPGWLGLRPAVARP